MGEAPATAKISKEEVITKLKDDGDFDRLRLKIIRKLKENEELRYNIIAVVKQSAALNRPDAESMKPRQLSDAIFDEVGRNVMAQISEGLWDIIRSEGGMKSEITETVESVYYKLVPEAQRKEGESSKHDDRNGSMKGLADDMLSDNEPNEPPGFSISNDHHQEQQPMLNQTSHQVSQFPTTIINDHQQQQPMLNQNGHVEEHMVDIDGISSDEEVKQPLDESDEDPDVPPGFG